VYNFSILNGRWFNACVQLSGFALMMLNLFFFFFTSIAKICLCTRRVIPSMQPNWPHTLHEQFSCQSALCAQPAVAVAVLRSCYCRAWRRRDRRPWACAAVSSHIGSTSFVMCFKWLCLHVTWIQNNTRWKSTALPTDSTPSHSLVLTYIVCLMQHQWESAVSARVNMIKCGGQDRV